MRTKTKPSARMIDAANRVLGTFASGARIEVRTGVGGGFYVHWPRWQGGEHCRRWMTRGCQDFYPIWSRYWCGGGVVLTGE